MNLRTLTAATAVFACLLTASTLGLAQVPKKDRWAGVTFPENQPVRLGFKLLFPFPTGAAPDIDCEKCDVLALGAEATITRRADHTRIEVRGGGFARNRRLYLFVVNPDGSTIRLRSTITNNEGGFSLVDNAERDTFMLVVSLSSTMGNLEKDPNLILASVAPRGFAVVPKN